jgi:hypothetical protein
LKILFFRLNNDFQTRYGAGHEPTEACSKFSQFSAEKIADTLNFFISALKNSKGIERNLLAKRFLEKIAYSPESIKISLFASQNPTDFGSQKAPPRFRGAGRNNRSQKTKIRLFRKIGSSYRVLWLRTVNNVRTIFERQNEYIYIPDLRTYANA